MHGTNLPKNLEFVNRRYVPLVKAHGRNVLHVGVGGAVTSDDITDQFLATDLADSVHGQLSKVAANMMGLDVNRRAVEAMCDKVPGRYVVGDVADPNLGNLIREQFDLILFLEVVQDLGNVDQALGNLKGLLKPEGELIVSACNAYSLERMLKMFFQYESIYPDHLCYYSYMTMKNLLQRHGFSIERCYFTYFPRKKRAGFVAGIIFNVINRFCRIWPQFGESVLVIARPTESDRQIADAEIIPL